MHMLYVYMFIFAFLKKVFIILKAQIATATKKQPISILPIFRPNISNY